MPEFKEIDWFWGLCFFAQAMLALGLLYRLGKGHLPWRWLVLSLLFVGTILFRADALWVGVLCLMAVFLVWKHLHQVYAGETRCWLLVGSGVITGLLLGGVFHSGLALALGLGLFSVLHCFLHEREEKDISYGQVSGRNVWRRWLRLWGVYWLLPSGVGFVAVLLAGRFFPPENVWPALPLQAMPSSGQQAGGIGYFSTFHQEFLMIFQDAHSQATAWQGAFFQDTAPMWMPLAVERALMAMQLALLGFLPVLGIVGLGSQVPNRFVYRLLQRPDEALLLIFVSGTALILGTLWHSTSGQIASNGLLALLMGFIALARWLRLRPRLEQVVYPAFWIFSLLGLLCLLWRVCFSGVGACLNR